VLGEGDRLTVWVEDEGPGIPPSERTKIFDKFYRGELSTKSPSGTGLGLAIVLEIIRSHGGRVWIEDVVPQGTRVVISLPREESGGSHGRA
jgi:signal transduction histidine kinase